ncbi:transcriptional regulator, TetR family [Actinoalloteichus hymeniacidonis]|uniref:Transcriptional regulator, TetR family n=1 Tax=Actinoalloteichus hymeniacidonis TaxID=340345 RepID=A0AAC9HPG6_9PSEU|nr:transcriptional regulator, TetR family [Actinoalloteichus hymeniacidonis]
MVLEAAAQLFDRNGLAATTNHIAERAGVSIGTVYQYFPRKQALLYALAVQHAAVATARLDTVFAELRDRQPSFEDLASVLASELVALHAARPRLHALMHRNAPRVAEGVAELHAFADRTIDEVSHHLIRCGLGGTMPELVAATLVHAVDAQLHRVLLEALPAPADQVDRLVALMLAVAGAAPEHRQA